VTPPGETNLPETTVPDQGSGGQKSEASGNPAPGSHFVLPLYLKLAILLGAVLLPAVIYSVLSAYSGYRESQARTQESIARFGELAAGRAQLLINSTSRLLVAIAATDFAATADEGQARCARNMDYLAGAFAEYTALAVVDAEGNVVCSSVKDSSAVNFSDRAWFQQARDSREVAISDLVHSKFNNLPVVVVAAPLGRKGESFRGAVSVGINVVWLAGLSATKDLPPQTVAFLIDRTGTVVTRSGQLIQASAAGYPASGEPDIVALPEGGHLRDALDRQLVQFTGRGSDGVARLYSLTGLSHTNLFVVLGIPESSSIGSARSDLLSRLFAVVAMLLCALVGVAVGGDLLVARNLRSLSATAEALQLGDYSARPHLKGGGSREVRQLADTLTNMAERVQRHEQDMSRSVQQKEAMLKEIHHRVKNNLQVVTSLMSIQANRLSDEASKRALAELQRRVRALGLLHRHLYEGDDLRYLDFGQFTVELCQMVKESSGPAARGVTIDVDIPPIPITADRAVPLGLLITEALGNSFKHGFPGGRPGVIRISLSVTPEGVATISIADNGVGPPASTGSANDSDATSGTGMLLMQAFAQQLGSMLTVEGPPGATVKFSFDLAEPGIIAPA
jgi:two-component sensor histidine kinase